MCHVLIFVFLVSQFKFGIRPTSVFVFVRKSCKLGCFVFVTLIMVYNPTP